MLRILESQLEHFGRRARDSFEGRMVAYLREHVPARVATLNDASLRAQIAEVVDRFPTYDVRLESDAAALVVVLCHLGWDADLKLGWLKGILADNELNGSGKLRTVLRAMEEMNLPEERHG